MIASSDQFSDSPPLLLFTNITSDQEAVYGDCAACGAEQVNMFSHDCKHHEDIAKQLIRSNLNLQPKKKNAFTRMATLVAIGIAVGVVSILAWSAFYVS